jgi:hypothetical protein
MAENYGSNRKTTGGSKIKDGTEGNFDMGQQAGFGTNKGSRKEGSGLKNDDGGGGGKFVDTDNDAKGDGFGGSLKKPRAGDA